ncbi:Kinesin motor domain-containing protein [Mycena sanguinolenta]|uniref:Kinesin motor domain-containing protein n=1 Tax=Mycena sanguinolenta TaxID=230812 RepID=A0A8H6YT88_9AGAR|nr:Kinesin motor domain-containing protein [Mycena sanguinolenta]
MATRRPPSSRAKAPPPPTRARSVLGQNKDDAETNIQVVVRCRRRSEQEVAANSPIIVSSTGAKSKELTVEVALPQSSLGVVTLAPVRTYPFDLVFGPEADQALIYHEVVSPMLEEVIMGYNCTLFAYGQTGTGKTHTMQGDLTPTPLGNPSANAGMIPRVLFRLFHQLESSGSDYSVKISFVELYNEELRDLLAADPSAPSGSKPAGKDIGAPKAPEGLKIFDDASKHGVFIQGLEEIAVKDSADALALLTKGSQRREVAATKFNDHSSRSHSVFTITVHVKEAGHVSGDDLLKIGKLNLVDLAGSENIGRSGAENKQAREAGMINQSLLTLGRVINALVDKAQHVPYRESKLTRLLQDSLGGRTKTCLIATVSPARANMEETLSTLDYAMRAKSIRNKPELNQRMTRNSLLKEYVAEIERLKADVLAAREKNGIFFSEETWLQLSAEQEMRQTELEEARRQVEIVEGHMRTVRDEFEQSIALLKKREGELNDTRTQLQETEVALDRKSAELQHVQGALEEEMVVREAHQETEGRLNTVALGLKVVVRDSVKDVTGLFDKLERKSSILTANTQAVLTHGKAISSATIALSRKLEEFIKASSQSTAKLQTEAKQFEAKELEALAGHSERVDQQLKRVNAALAMVQAKDTAEAEALVIVQTALKEMHESFRVGFTTWASTLTKSCETTCNQANEAGLEAFGAVEKALKAMGSVVENVVREACSFVDSERHSIAETKELAANTAAAEIARLRNQNQLLARMLEEERVKGGEGEGRAASARFGAARRAANVKAEEGMKVFEREHADLAEAMETKGKEVARGVEKWSTDAKRTRDGALKSVQGSKTQLSSELASMQSTVSGSIDSYSTHVQAQMQSMNATCSTAFDRQASAKRARIETTTSLGAEIQSDYKALQRGFASTSRNIEGAVGRVVSESASLSSVTDTYHKISRGELSSTTNATKALAEHGAKADTSTGTTPRKRVWQYVDQWELTKSRTELLQTWRAKAVSGVGSDTFLAEHRPLPDPEAEEDDQENVDAMAVDEDVRSPLSESGGVGDSPEAVSLASSASSSNAPPPPRQIPVPKKTGIASRPAIPLMDTRNVLAVDYVIHFSLRLRLEFPYAAMAASIRTVVFLAMVLAVGFLMIILSCVLYANWLPLLVALIFVLAPLPNALFAHCGSDEFSEGSSGPVDLGRFITGTIVTSGFALPLVLAHAQVIHTPACVMSIIGGGLVYGTILAYSAAFQEESEFD